MAKTTKTAVRKKAPNPHTTHASVQVRMYRQGLGDCFLLSFPRTGGGTFYILIDCGVILGTPDASTLMNAVVDDIVKTTDGKIDVLVATHEHWDHVSGFDQAKEQFDALEVGQVWLAWTEDPHNRTAQRLRRERTQKLAALWMGIGQMRRGLDAGTGNDAANESLGRAAEILTFFGIDADHDQPPGGGFGAAAAAAGGKTGAAMAWVREKTHDPRFWKPGDLIDLPDAGGVRVYVLGPPTDQEQLFKDLPTRSGQETYEEQKAHAAGAERAFFAAAFGQAGGRMQQEFDGSLPFDKKYQMPWEQAAGHEFFQDHYFGTGSTDSETWRRVDGDWTAGAAEFALQLDSDTNNTSLALAFELPDGRVLLFPGDAQVGNWESWHADSAGKKRVWSVAGREVTAEQLLNHTVLYKVGHHGSHNATLREKGLEMMTHEDLAAMIPVDVYIAHEKKKWTKMPFNPLMSRLNDVAHGRILQADVAACAAPGGRTARHAAGDKETARFLSQVRDSTEQIEVAGTGGKTVKRPLYVDYLLK